MRDYVRAVKACFAVFRTGKLDHHGEFYDLDFITPQWSAGPIDAPDPKVDVAAVNPWTADGGRSGGRCARPSAPPAPTNDRPLRDQLTFGFG
jgi:hypothetical protein